MAVVTTVKTTVTEICPLGGATLGGYKLGWLAATQKLLDGDKIQITNASLVDTAFLQSDLDGAEEANTKSTNIITLLSGTAAINVRGLIIYK